MSNTPQGDTAHVADTETVKLLFEPDGKSVTVAAGTPLSLAAARADHGIEQPCGGLGLCGQCRVEFIRNAPTPTAEEQRWLTPHELEHGWRLACRHQATGSATVSVPTRSRYSVQQILEHGDGRDVTLDPLVKRIRVKLARPSLTDDRGDWERLTDALREAGYSVNGSVNTDLLVTLPERLRQSRFEVSAIVADTHVIAVEAADAESLYGIAADVGTTTLVVYLMDMTTGQELATAAGMNPQVAYGDDLIARIHHAATPQGKRELQRAVIDGLNRLILDACTRADANREQIHSVTLVGNTCMTHLVLGLDVSPLGMMPYVPVVKSPVQTAARRLGLRVAGHAPVYVLPAIGGFVGADTVGVGITHMAAPDSPPRLAVDIGTNGEILLQHGTRRWACSAAAGPAFEGAGIRCGMRGAPGAIAAVTINGDVEYTTIENRPARGICGSGLLDAVAQMLDSGIVDEAGRMIAPEEESRLPETLRKRLRGGEAEREFVFVPAADSATGEDIVLTQRDIRQFQLAKGSICAAISTLLSVAEIQPAAIDRVFLAGAFGTFLRIESALRVGLLPPFPRECVEAVGNAAAVGAKLSLLSRVEWETARSLAATTEHLTLSNHPDYQMFFMEQMAFPMADL